MACPRVDADLLKGILETIGEIWISTKYWVILNEHNFNFKCDNIILPKFFFKDAFSVAYLESCVAQV